MKIDGECQCGKITFEATVDPAASSICNCTDCQKFSGSPWRASIAANAEAFRITRGTPKEYIKTGASGSRRALGFCGDCGSPIYATSEKDRVKYNIRLGAVNQRAALPPQRQIWMDSAIMWGQDVSGVPGVRQG